MTGVVLCFSIGILGYFVYVRPHIHIHIDKNDIWMRNTGRSTALIHKVDLLLYRDGQVFYIENTPDIDKEVEPGQKPFLLRLPLLEESTTGMEQGIISYMKMTMRYRMPGIPFFRYTSVSFLRYGQEEGKWHVEGTIPVKYRSLGKLGRGDVGQRKLDF